MNEEPMQELVKFYIGKAEDTLEDAKILAERKRWNSCLNRLYYSCFYAVQAVLLKRIFIKTKTHSGLKNLFHKHLVKEGLISREQSLHYSYLMERRGEGDYGDFEILTEEEVIPLISNTEAFYIL